MKVHGSFSFNVFVCFHHCSSARVWEIRAVSVSRWEEEGWRLDTEDREIFQSGVPAPGPGPVLRELRPPAPPITGPCGCGNHDIKFWNIFQSHNSPVTAASVTRDSGHVSVSRALLRVMRVLMWPEYIIPRAQYLHIIQCHWSSSYKVVARWVSPSAAQPSLCLLTWHNRGDSIGTVSSVLDPVPRWMYRDNVDIVTIYTLSTVSTVSRHLGPSTRPIDSVNVTPFVPLCWCHPINTPHVSRVTCHVAAPDLHRSPGLPSSSSAAASRFSSDSTEEMMPRPNGENYSDYSRYDIRTNWLISTMEYNRVANLGPGPSSDRAA